MLLGLVSSLLYSSLSLQGPCHSPLNQYTDYMHRYETNLKSTYPYPRSSKRVISCKKVRRIAEISLIQSHHSRSPDLLKKDRTTLTKHTTIYTQVEIKIGNVIIDV